MKPFITILIATIAFMRALAIEPQRNYHSISGIVNDTVLTVPALPASVSSTLELRMDFPDKKIMGKNNGKISFSWYDINNVLWNADFGFSNSGTDEIIDNDYITLCVKNGDNNDIIIDKQYYDIITDINSEISLCLDITEDEIAFSAGNNYLKKIDIATGSFNPSSTIYIKVNGKIEICSVVSEFTRDMKAELSTGLDRDDILNRIKNLPQPTGIWNALDRDTDSRLALAGGRYSLAIIPSENSTSYDIIYLDGAEVNSDEWSSGMIKGKLFPTSFRDHYDLIWYDSQMELIEHDATATVEQNIILSLSFPLLKSTLRFVRQ